MHRASMRMKAGANAKKKIKDLTIDMNVSGIKNLGDAGL
jgi:hypothetical protein